MVCRFGRDVEFFVDSLSEAGVPEIMLLIYPELSRYIGEKWADYPVR